MSHITIVDADDWVGLYIDDDLVYQGHDIEPEALLNHVGIFCTSFYVDSDWMSGRDNLPARLDEVKREEE